jgi:hypothetical protein
VILGWRMCWIRSLGIFVLGNELVCFCVYLAESSLISGLLDNEIVYILYMLVCECYHFYLCPMPMAHAAAPDNSTQSNIGRGRGRLH